MGTGRGSVNEGMGTGGEMGEDGLHSDLLVLVSLKVRRGKPMSDHAYWGGLALSLA